MIYHLLKCLLRPTEGNGDNVFMWALTMEIRGSQHIINSLNPPSHVSRWEELKNRIPIFCWFPSVGLFLGLHVLMSHLQLCDGLDHVWEGSSVFYDLSLPRTSSANQFRWHFLFYFAQCHWSMGVTPHFSTVAANQCGWRHHFLIITADNP